MVSLVVTGLIVILFGLPESSLGPVFLGSIVVTIACIYYASNRESKNSMKSFSKKQNEIDINRKKRLLVDKATDFCDSRHNIAKVAALEFHRQERLNKKRNSLIEPIEYDIKQSFSKMSFFNNS